ncbi:hypothetical protein P7K49_001590 [Saguinus oedipus]|uniref:Uncharacterized protein n=1 Tax=Saguinus oedipus TaxID=9490 RepID=A0ABQ9WGT2_SAGOE|nr:hypothetical protein P7K49_001590 [Saguinus oedipus]
MQQRQVRATAITMTCGNQQGNPPEEYEKAEGALGKGKHPDDRLSAAACKQRDSENEAAQAERGKQEAAGTQIALCFMSNPLALECLEPVLPHPCLLLPGPQVPALMASFTLSLQWVPFGLPSPQVAFLPLGHSQG